MIYPLQVLSLVVPKNILLLIRNQIFQCCWCHFIQHLARRAARKPVKALTAGIVPHHVKSPRANMTIYDLAGHREYYSSHSSILELISKTTPSVFLLLVNLLLSLENIIAQIYYWSLLISNVCHNCPQQSSIIVVGTHADCIGDRYTLRKRNLRYTLRFAFTFLTIIIRQQQN